MLTIGRDTLSAFGLAWCVLATTAAGADPTIPAEINFGEHIRPIFNQHCTACHGGVKQAADLSFVYRDKVLPPDGWIVEPGKPEESLIIERVTSDDPYEVMPPPEHGSPLSDDEIALLKAWIEQGATWQAHWAYERPQEPSIPKVQNAAWPRDPIDRFVLARLESEGITPANEAAEYRWLRRVSLDLIGLPPTPQEIRAFQQDVKTRGEAAYVDVVERLLKSPHYGERWASPWLDQVRYADSKGLGLDGRRNIWKYRDWVISALNRDMPYDEFTVKQIAGDQLLNPTIDDQIATAVHRLTQSNEEGGTDDEEFRVAAVLDRVSTTWQVWQGVTFGCVQCHSHPYGPFEHEEFYRFAAFFNNTADCDLNEEWPVVEAPLDPEKYDLAGKLDRQITDLQREIWKQEFSVLSDTDTWSPLTGLIASSSNDTKVQVARDGEHDEFFTAGTVSRNTDITLEVPISGDEQNGLDQITALRVTIEPHDVDQAVADSEWGFVLSHVAISLVVPGEDEPRELSIDRVIIDEPQPFFDPAESLNPKSNRGFAAYSRIHYPRQAAFVLPEPLDLPGDARLRVTLKHRVSLLGAFALISRRGHLAVTEDERFLELLRDEHLTAKRERLAELEKERSEIESTTVPVLRERPERLSRPTHVFERGLFLTKAQKVTPGVPASLPPLPADVPATRLALAKWLVSPENPLTARVAVNRFWARLFGTGLVATEEDFGSSGEPPSHPALLDFLALRFQNEHDWSVKKLLREMVLSSTYRQSSAIRPELQERDANNRLLARGPQHRLPAEIVRDQALYVSGLMSHELFGPPVNPPIPDGVWRPFASGDKWTTPEPGKEDRYRRSIYTYTKRSIPYPMFAAFDAPSREFCAPRRLRSNTPLQALMTLNDATFVECSHAFAERIERSEQTPRDQIAYGFECVTCREPRSAELEALLNLYEFKERDSAEEQTPTEKLRRVASVLLNLDEFLTK